MTTCHGPYFVHRKSDRYGMGIAPAPFIFDYQYFTE